MNINRSFQHVEAVIRKIGLIGGVSWPATILYYEGLCRAARDLVPGGSPRISIESLDMRETLDRRGTPGDTKSWARYDKTFRDAFASLEGVGCEVGAIASVTPHGRFGEAIAGTGLQVVSILDTTAQALGDRSLNAAIVLGTAVTMSGTWFHDALSHAGIDCPDVMAQHDIDEIANMLETFFYPGIGIDGRSDLLAFCHRIMPQTTKTAIILACTDLSAAFPEFAQDAVFELEGLTFVDAGTAHIQAIYKAAMMPD